MKQNFVLQRDLRRKQQLAENISSAKQQKSPFFRAKIEEKAYMVKHLAPKLDKHGRLSDRAIESFLCSLAN